MSSNPGPTSHPRPTIPSVPTANANTEDPFMKAASMKLVSDLIYNRQFDGPDAAAIIAAAIIAAAIIAAAKQEPSAIMVSVADNIVLLAHYDLLFPTAADDALLYPMRPADNSVQVCLQNHASKYGTER